MLRQRTTAVGVGVLVALTAAGCSADAPAAPQAAAPPPVTTASPTTSAPTASVAPVPIATVSLPAPTFRPEGTFNEDDAIGFAAYYLLVLNYARATGDPALLREISEPDCITCHTLAALIDEHRQREWTNVDGDISFNTAELRYSDPAKLEADVNLELVTKDSKLVSRDGGVVASSVGSTSDQLVQMHMRNGAWFIQELPAP